MKNMTYAMLVQLWWKEGCTDPEIAALYDVPKKKVTNLRNKWGVKAPETIVNEFTERFSGEIPPLDGRESGIVSSPDGANLLQKIHDLNDVELESLRLELARRYTRFAEVKHEVEFLETVEKVIGQFWNQSQ